MSLAGVRLRHRVLPEVPLEAVSLQTMLFGRVHETPIVVTSEHALVIELDPLRGKLRSLDDIVLEAAQLAPDPVVVKVVGGVDLEDLGALGSAGLAALQVQAGDFDGAFDGWGLTLREAIAEVRAAHPSMPVIACGGLYTGVDVAKCLALGATACELDGGDPATAAADLRMATWLAGAASAQELSTQHLR